VACNENVVGFSADHRSLQKKGGVVCATREDGPHGGIHQSASQQRIVAPPSGPYLRAAHPIGALVCVLGLLLGSIVGCNKSNDTAQSAGNSSTAPTTKRAEYTFALVAKSQGNPVFQAARTGAEDAAAEIGGRLGVKINVLWRTPNEEDAQKQAETIEALALQGIDGLSVSCSNSDTLTPAINDAVDKGIAVMCFDSDAPASKRFCFHGTDDITCGHTIMGELIKVLGPGKHVVAIPGGNQNAFNLQNRIKGALEEAKKYPDITVSGVYYSKETPQDCAAKVDEVQTAHPEIDGWAMIGAWCLFTDALMKWEPGKVKIVAMDALPPQLPYLRAGIVQKLYAQQTYGWGHRSIEILADKVISGKDPAQVMDYAPLVPVTTDNVDQFEQNWKKWLR
jgi:ribose transport system substrate-binding protein